MEDLESIIDLIDKHVPQYLTVLDKEILKKDILEMFPKSYSQSKVFKQLLDIDYFYQGDLIQEIPFPELGSQDEGFKLLFHNACILSNTCDIDPRNERLVEPNVTFAVVIPLKDYITGLTNANIDPTRITNHITDIKNNSITNLFYLPEHNYNSQMVLEESIIRFDKTVSIPLSKLDNYNKNYIHNDGDRYTSLSNYGFYLLLFKISVHFCRFREGVFR